MRDPQKLIFICVAAAIAIGAWAMTHSRRSTTDPGGTASAVPRQVHPGDRATAPQPREVVSALQADGSATDCLILQGRIVTVVAVQGSKVLLRYARSGDPVERECAEGAQFIYPMCFFESMDEDYRRNIAKQEDERKLIERARERN